MSWFTENKVFSSILVALLLAAAVLAYLTFDAHSQYAAAEEAYQTKMQQLVGLRGLAPYRNGENLEKVNAQVVSYREITNNLHDELLRRQGELAPVDPAAFQARLRESVSKTVANAAEKKVQLPDKFYLGFENYENQLPRNDIASLLNWQLNAVQLAVNRLIDLRVTRIISVTRLPLPGETVVEAPSKEQPLLKKYPFQIAFIGNPREVTTFLNDVSSTPEFIIPRAVKIENEARKSPPRNAEAATVTTPDGQTAPAPALDKIIIGKEKITASIIFDLVQFTSKPSPKK